MKISFGILCCLALAALCSTESNEVKSENEEQSLQRSRRWPGCQRQQNEYDQRPNHKRQKKLQKCLDTLDVKCNNWHQLLLGHTLNKIRRRILEGKLLDRCNISCCCVDGSQSCVHYDSPVCTHSPNTYAGEKSTTRSGNECQNWSVDTPHPSAFHSVGNHNYCRNPDHKKGPWCYTTDSGDKLDFCFPNCDGVEKLQPCVLYDSCAVPGRASCVLDEYTGTRSVTRDIAPCDNWLNHGITRYGNSSYCRNPDGAAQPYCYSATGPVPCFPEC